RLLRRVKRWTCWFSLLRRSPAHSCLLFSATWTFPSCTKSRQGVSRSTPALFRYHVLERSKMLSGVSCSRPNVHIAAVLWSMYARILILLPHRRASRSFVRDLGTGLILFMVE